MKSDEGSDKECMHRYLASYALYCDTSGTHNFFKTQDERLIERMIMCFYWNSNEA